MSEELQNIVEEYRANGYPLEDKEAEEIKELCYRKMEVANIKDKEGYLPLLFKDMVKEHFFRMAVNAKSILMMMEKEGEGNVRDMQTDTLSPKMSECAGA